MTTTQHIAERFDKILENAELGIRLMKSAQPGCGDMETRKQRKAQARPYLDAFFKVRTWPGYCEPAVRKIEDSILNGYV